MERDPLLSDLSREELEELCLSIIDEVTAREHLVDASPGVRRIILNILRKLGPTPQMIRGLADEAHVDLGPLVERVRDQGCPEAPNLGT